MVGRNARATSSELESEDGGRKGMEISRSNTKPIAIRITIIITLLFCLIMMKSDDTPAFVLFLQVHADEANFGGPTPGAEDTPQKRGPLPPPTCGRGRLPNKRGKVRKGLVPQLTWPLPRSHYTHLPDKRWKEEIRHRPA